MGFDLNALIRQREGENWELHAAHVNPQFARVLRTIGFDRVYTRAEGPYLYDQDGRQYIDFLSGYGVFNIGRNHPVVRRALADFLESGQPSLVQMDPPLLSGLLAEELKKRVPESLDTVYFTNSGTGKLERSTPWSSATVS